MYSKLKLHIAFINRSFLYIELYKPKTHKIKPQAMFNLHTQTNPSGISSIVLRNVWLYGNFYCAKECLGFYCLKEFLVFDLWLVACGLKEFLRNVRLDRGLWLNEICGLWLKGMCGLIMTWWLWLVVCGYHCLKEFLPLFFLCFKGMSLSVYRWVNIPYYRWLLSKLLTNIWLELLTEADISYPPRRK